jgi:hypothetical protein
MVGDRQYEITDVHRDPRTGVAITAVVRGPDGLLWLGNPACKAARS